MNVYMGAEGRMEDYIYLQLMEREWRRPATKDEITLLRPEEQPSAHAGIVILFWTYFETRIERLLRGIWHDAPPVLIEDALARYVSISSRLERFYRLSCNSTYFADLSDLGYGDIASLLALVRIRRNEFAHGAPRAIDDTLVRQVVENLKREHESWVAVYNRRAAKPPKP